MVGRQLRLLLCERRERSRRRNVEPRDELAPQLIELHSIPLLGPRTKEYRIRAGREGDILTRPAYVGFTPESGHSAVQNKCPLWVISGHLQCKTACPLPPCVDGSGLARAFFTYAAALVGAPVCSAFCAAHVAAGHNALRGSGPKRKPAFDNAWG
jgi:hypothetical protein